MISHTLNLVRWEWFKLRRRWMPWILLAILLLFSQLAVWGNFFQHRDLRGDRFGTEFTFGYTSATGEQIEVRVSCADVLAGEMPDIPPGAPPGFLNDIAGNLEQWQQICEGNSTAQQDQLQSAFANFTLPGSLPNALFVAQDIGLILIAILTASMIGSEFNWGTVRSVLVRGTGRWQYLAAKLVLLALLFVAALIIVVAATVVSSTVAEALAETPPAQAVLSTSSAPATWGNAVTTFGKSILAVVPYIALAGLITVVTTSSAAGMAIALGYNFAEEIAVAILINVFDWFQTPADYILGRNITAWMLGSQSEDLSRAGVNMGIIFGEYPDTLHAFLVLAVYVLALGGLAFWLFRRRDIAAVGGG